MNEEINLVLVVPHPHSRLFIYQIPKLAGK